VPRRRVGRGRRLAADPRCWADLGGAGRGMKKLQFQGEKSPSLGPKLAITSWYLACVAGAVWLTLAGPIELKRPGNIGRQIALLACVVIYVARAAHTLFVFVKRKIPWWEAAWGGSIIGCVLFFFLVGGLRAPQAIGSADLVGVLLYIAGSYIGTASEHSRHVWKTRPENRGNLYTEGLSATAATSTTSAICCCSAGVPCSRGSCGRVLCPSPWV